MSAEASAVFRHKINTIFLAILNHCFFKHKELKIKSSDRARIFLQSPYEVCRELNASKIYLISQKLGLHLCFAIKRISYLSTATFPRNGRYVHVVQKNNTFFAQIIDMPKTRNTFEYFLWENRSMFAFIMRYVHLMGNVSKRANESRKKLGCLGQPCPS